MFEKDLAWAAGFMDGEGCVLVCRARNKGTKTGINHTLTLTVTNTDIRPLHKFQLMFGGYVRIDKHTSAKRKRTIFKWIITSRGAVEVLIKLLPYLVVKAEQAKVAIEYPFNEKNMYNRAGMDRSVFNKREEITLKLRELRMPNG